MNSLLVAYLPALYFGSGFVPFLIVTWGFRLVFPSKRSFYERRYFAVGGLVTCGFVALLSVPPGWKVLAGLLAGLAVGFALPNEFDTGVETIWSNWETGLLVALILLVVGAGLVLRVVNLDGYGVRIDEPKHLKTAVGFLKTGEYRKWDFFRQSAGPTYSRAFLFTRMVAFGYHWLGPTLASARAVSVLWGVLLFLPAWFLSRTLELEGPESLILFFWIACSPYLVAISRWVRFYGAFTTLLLTALLCFYWYLKHDHDRKAYVIGLLGLLSFLLALHLQLIGLLPVLGVLGYLLVKQTGSGESVHVPTDRLIVGGVVLVVLVCSIPSPVGGSFFYLSDSGSAWGELTQTITFRPLYVTYLFREPFGYLLGGILSAGLLVVRSDREAERYFFWVLVLPAICYLFFARRIPQVRFVGYLYPISFALMILVLRRMVSALTGQRRLLSYLATGFIALVVPLGLMGHGLPKVVAGQMGIVGFPGAPSPAYRNWVDDFPRSVDRDDLLVVYNIPDVYAPRLRETGAELHWVSRSRRPQPSLNVERLRRAREQGRDIWVVTLRNFSGLDTVAINYLRNNFRVIEPERWRNIRVYYSEGTSP